MAAFPGAPAAFVDRTTAVPGGWRGSWTGVPAVDLDVDDVHGSFLIPSALCVADDEAACVRTVQAVTPPVPLSLAGVVATCPDGMFAISGGARLTGDPQGVALTAIRTTGMFAPTGIEATAEHVGPAPWAPGGWR